jgi:hypothetical protein
MLSQRAFCCRLRVAGIEWTQGARTTLPVKKRDTFNQPKEAKMPAVRKRLGAFSAALTIIAATSTAALAQKKYDVGATDTEIKIGNIMAYSGPASA